MKACKSVVNFLSAVLKLIHQKHSGLTSTAHQSHGRVIRLQVKKVPFSSKEGWSVRIVSVRPTFGNAHVANVGNAGCDCSISTSWRKAGLGRNDIFHQRREAAIRCGCEKGQLSSDSDNRPTRHQIIFRPSIAPIYLVTGTAFVQALIVWLS